MSNQTYLWKYIARLSLGFLICFIYFFLFFPSSPPFFRSLPKSQPSDQVTKHFMTLPVHVWQIVDLPSKPWWRWVAGITREKTRRENCAGGGSCTEEADMRVYSIFFTTITITFLPHVFEGTGNLNQSPLICIQLYHKKKLFRWVSLPVHVRLWPNRRILSSLLLFNFRVSLSLDSSK